MDVTVKHMQKGGTLISSLYELAHPLHLYSINMDSIPLSAYTQVIYMPPFYLTHTPGLFEGTLVKESSQENDMDPEIREFLRRSDRSTPKRSI